MAPATPRALLAALCFLAVTSCYLYSKSSNPPWSRNKNPHARHSPQYDDSPFARSPHINVPASHLGAQDPPFPFGPCDHLVESEPFEPRKRFSLDYGKVACWQDGGIWIKELTPVDMVSLGVDRVRDTESTPIQADEDVFCERLRMYGASFWELPPRWPLHVVWCGAIDACAEPTSRVSLEVGFPTGGGLWFLNTTRPKRRGLELALTMDERCEVLRELGVSFCEDPEACPGFKEAQQGEMVDHDARQIDW